MYDLKELRLPKLSNGLAKKAYIEKKLDVAQVDGRRLLSDRSRKLANMPKEVPTGPLKTKTQKVASSPFFPCVYFMRKPIFFRS